MQIFSIAPYTPAALASFGSLVRTCHASVLFSLCMFTHRSRVVRVTCLFCSCQQGPAVVKTWEYGLAFRRTECPFRQAFFFVIFAKNRHAKHAERNPVGSLLVVQERVRCACRLIQCLVRLVTPHHMTTAGDRAAPVQRGAQGHPGDQPDSKAGQS